MIFLVDTAQRGGQGRGKYGQGKGGGGRDLNWKPQPQTASGDPTDIGKKNLGCPPGASGPLNGHFHLMAGVTCSQGPKLPPYTPRGVTSKVTAVTLCFVLSSINVILVWRGPQFLLSHTRSVLYTHIMCACNNQFLLSHTIPTPVTFQCDICHSL